VYGGRLDTGDPLRREWTIIALGAHTATALAARDCGDAGPDAERRFDCTVTHDRQLVERAAHTVLSAWAAAR
jgi:DICT domain-containing protein